MFDRSEGELKFSHVYQDRTAARFGDGQDESFVGEVEVEKQYVERLKNQRGKIETLYSKYDSLFKDLKNKEGQIKEKDKAIYSLENKCKNLAVTSQESGLFRQQNKEIKSENSTLQRAISELQQSYNFLHGQYKTKESFSSQKYEDMEMLNDELMSKLRSLSKKYQQKEEQYSQKLKKMQSKLQEALFEGKRQRDQYLAEEQLLKTAILQKDEDIKLLQTENQCLKERISELQSYVNELLYESQAKLDESQKQKKVQMKLLKNQIETLRETNCVLQKKWLKLKQEFQAKQTSLGEMTMVIEHYQKQSSESFSQMKQQFSQEKSQLKQQLIQYQNYIGKLQRKMIDCMRREEYLHGKIKKYENCLSAKRNLREVEREQLDKINKLLSMP